MGNDPSSLRSTMPYWIDYLQPMQHVHLCRMARTKLFWAPSEEGASGAYPAPNEWLSISRPTGYFLFSRRHLTLRISQSYRHPTAKGMNFFFSCVTGRKNSPEMKEISHFRSYTVCMLCHIIFPPMLSRHSYVISLLVYLIYSQQTYKWAMGTQWKDITSGVEGWWTIKRIHMYNCNPMYYSGGSILDESMSIKLWCHNQNMIVFTPELGLKWSSHKLGSSQDQIYSPRVNF